MPDIGSYLSQIGLPAGAIALAVVLVRGAKALEKDMRRSTLHSFSDLLIKGDLRNLGKAGTGLVPYVFDRVFGSKSFSIRFISRSIIATTFFWFILLFLKLVDQRVKTTIILESWRVSVFLFPLWYTLDWLSLSKARLLIKMISTKRPILSSFFFLFTDIIVSYALAFIFTIIVVELSYEIFNFASDGGGPLKHLKNLVQDYVYLWPIREYFNNRENIDSAVVIVPSTMLTSVWTFLLFVSCLIAQLFAPLDYVRRITSSVFPVERHPLTAIAWVAGTLIVVGAMVVRWVY